MKLLPLLLIFPLMGVRGDIPVDCRYEDIKGKWIFYETERSGNSALNCSIPGAFVHKKVVSLLFPNVAEDEYGNRGTWTMIYNEGFEVRVSGRSYFAFSNYETRNNTVLSHCDETFVGRSHDVTLRNWACFKGKKTESVKTRVHKEKVYQDGETFYKIDKDLLTSINADQNSWVAGPYPEMELMKMKHIIRRSGGLRAAFTKPTAALANPLTRFRSAFLPQSWDWRDVAGVNYVSPVRNQRTCGSCYAFAAMGALESRVRILTRNEQKPIFSPQDIIGCSKLSQGCDGGFPYLIAGRYGFERGVVLEECYPYEGEDTVCINEKKCLRHYTSHYKYTGGYYGACNEDEMKLALVKGGPLAMGFEVMDDFNSYESGIYHHTGLKNKFSPFEKTNHAVLLVGYGQDKHTEEKFWIVKNSWGKQWGEDGYFRIRRGTDECGFESMAVEVVPIPA